jgi:hypothetical protein
MGGSSMELVFRQGMGGQSVIQVLDRWVGCAIEGWDIFRGGRFRAMDIDNQSLHLTTLRSAGEFRVVRPAQKSDGKIGVDLFFSDATMGWIPFNG